jgi:S-adenosylmethionine:tRNA-ribosyltransferase-isomerase (queuine synthetase)
MADGGFAGGFFAAALLWQLRKRGPETLFVTLEFGVSGPGLSAQGFAPTC